MEPQAPPTRESAEDHAETVGAFLAMTPEDQIAFMEKISEARKLMAAGEDVHVSVPKHDVAKAEHFTRMIRTTGLKHTLSTLRRPVQGSGSRRPAVRTRERRSSAGRRRSTSTSRDDGDPEPPPTPSRRRFVVDDHYLVVAVGA